VKENATSGLPDLDADTASEALNACTIDFGASKCTRGFYCLCPYNDFD
jgi:hypothetical protein